tara:strand:+ start:129 stop:410 length:282 start_codon:yes stop_codon:yes gene_type:complete
MLVKLISIERAINGAYALKEVLINPKHILMVTEAPTWRKRLAEGVLPEGLHAETSFSRLVLVDSNYNREMVIIGTPAEIENKVAFTAKRLLRG